MKDALRTAQIVGEREHARGIAAGIKANRWALPVDPRPAVAALQAQIAVAITQPDANRTRTFIAFDVAVGAAQIVEDVIDNRRQTFRAGAEEALRGGKDFILRIGLLRLSQRFARKEKCSARAQRKAAA